MRVVVSGASGLIGRALVPALVADGHQVIRLVRREPQGTAEVGWDPAHQRLDPEALAGADAVVNLSGAPAAPRRWTARRRRLILTSRLDPTYTLANAIAAARPRPRVLLSASAIGWYGDTGSRPVGETEPAGAGFMAGVCEQWEAATAPAADAGTRVVPLRTGLVLAPGGGLLGPMLPVFRLGLGGRLGSGRQYMSWISLADHVAATRFLLTAGSLSGPVNLTAPQPVTNAEFTRALGAALRRPAAVAVPGFVLRAVFGGFADEAALSSQRVLPAALTAAGFAFTHPTVDSALRWVVRRDPAPR